MTAKRDSFDHRIDDDLFEVILSYLPIEDKFKYESVSKRFQRFVFNKQNALRITRFFSSIDNLYYAKLITDSQMDVSKLVSLLKKLQLLTKIQIYPKLANMSDVLNAITDNCNHLNAFLWYFDGVDSETIKRFCKKFGQQLKHIEFGPPTGVDNWETVDKRFAEYLFECSPNLLSVSYIHFNLLNSLLIPKGLGKIETLFLLCDGNQDQISSFPTEDENFVKNLIVCINVISEESYEFVKILPQLKNLKQLKVLFFGSIKSDLFIKSMETIAKCCHRLESFTLQLEFDFNSNIDKTLVFKSMDHFSRLKKLQLIYLGSEETISDLKPLNNCKNLSSLFLRASRGTNDNILEGIQLIVPQLKRLTVGTDLITDRSLESIAKLKHLRHLEIIRELKGEVTDEAVQKLKDDCPLLHIGIS